MRLAFGVLGGALVFFCVGCDPTVVVDAGEGLDAPLPDGAVPDAPRLDGGGTCTSQADCDDDVFCNGAEQCMPGVSGAGPDGCLPAVDPCMASQTCDETLNACQTECDLEPDADGDGRRAITCGGDDCDDADPNRYPGNPEVCDISSHDEDCRPTTFGFVDADSDTFIDAACCNLADDGSSLCGDDCNDLRPGVHPGLPEACDGADNDCDTFTDEGVRDTFYLDSDGDGRGVADAATDMEACLLPPNYSPLADDCAPADPTTFPGAYDACDDLMVDNDCDGTPNNPPDGCLCVAGEPPRPCLLPGACSAASEVCSGGTWDDAACRALSRPEICDGIDNNCDGTTDDGVTIQCYVDPDGDRFAAPGTLAVEVCPDPSRPLVGGCPAGLTDRAPFGADLDCDGANRDVFPGATETCNGINDDCDAALDEGLRITCYEDLDNDAYAPPTSGGTLVCPDGSRPTFGMCPLFTTNRPPAMGADCADNNSLRSPGLAEVCDLFMVDEDCDTMVNEGVTIDCYADGDRDGFAPTGTAPTGLCADSGSNCPTGYTRTVPGVGTTDCNDANAAIAPTRAETCNLVDDNCNTMTDEGVQTRFYRDMDNDLFGDAAMSVLACTAPSGYVGNSTDCNDAVQLIRPGVPEVCNGLDDNCVGGADDGLPAITVYRDADGDGYGSLSGSAMRCGAVGGYVLNATDCNDTPVTGAGIHPGASDLCGNGIDEDCSGTADLPLPTWYPDNDNDTYGSSSGTVTQCTAPAIGLWATRGGDCRDGVGFNFVYPGAPELCDGLDTDCSTVAVDAGEVPNSAGLNHPLEDNDDDGYGDLSCVPPPAVAATVAAFLRDCDDGASTTHPGATEVVGDGIDESCDGMEVCFRDLDSDGYRAIDTALTVSSADADCADATEGALAEPATDCNESNAAVSPGDVEVADNGIDDNCSGTHGCYFDGDNDGFSRSDAAVRDDSPNASCAEAGEGSSVEPRTDCNDASATVSPGDPELADNGIDDNCSGLFGCYFDSDNDGYSRSDAAIRDDSANAACTDFGEGTLAEPRTDCNDTNAAISPGDVDLPDNGIDDNCSGLHVCYHDTDSDGYRLATSAEMSTDPDCSDPGEGRTIEASTECCDTDARANPGATMYYTTTRTGCGGYDYDCNGTSNKLYVANHSCGGTAGSCGGTGWSTTTDPACGVSGFWSDCTWDATLRECNFDGYTLVQACR